MSNGTLTIADIEKLFDAMWDNESTTIARVQFANAGYMLLSKALDQGIINESEHLYLASTIALNGGLIVSPAMNERLKQVSGD